MRIWTNNSSSTQYLNGSSVQLDEINGDLIGLLTGISIQLSNVGLDVTCCSDGDGYVTYNICEVGTSLISGTHSPITYELIADFERIYELKYVENELNKILPRLAAVGWKVVLARPNVGYIEYNHANSSDFRFTYEEFWALKARLERAEARRYLIMNSHIEGFDAHIQLREDAFVVDGKVTPYTKAQAEAAIRGLDYENAFK